MVILALVLVVAVERAPALAAADRPELRPSGQCTSVTLEPVNTPSAPPVGEPSRGPVTFPAASTLDLTFRTTLAPIAAGHRLVFRVFTPKGHLYQELAAQSDSGSKLTRDARLPVAGTEVVNHSLYGTWTVSAHVDGAAQPCSRSRAFSLVP